MKTIILIPFISITIENMYIFLRRRRNGRGFPPADTADQVPEGSLRAAPQNTSRGAVTLSWAPPEDPNGGVVAYILKLRGVSVGVLSRGSLCRGGRRGEGAHWPALVREARWQAKPVMTRIAREL